jgi:GT2 family glycosyltransferase
MHETRMYRAAVEDRPLPRMAVIIATRGRAKIVTATLAHLLATQTLKPATIIVSCVSLEDAGNAADLPGVTIVTGPGGLPAQRNSGLAALNSTIDAVVFFDDDFVADEGWLAAAARIFRDEPDVVGVTGHVLADGINGPGLSFDEALNILATDNQPLQWSRIERYSPYGCNMAFRRSAIGELRFDERLVLYGWQEDRDFGAALAKRGGRLIKCASARGVHLGVKGGRVAGDRLGYSQVVNPIYMLQKGTMTGGQVASHVFRNIAKNLARAPKPEPFIDRKGRLRGNLRGLADVLRGRIEPERAAVIAPAREGRTSANAVLSSSEGGSDGITGR